MSVDAGARTRVRSSDRRVAVVIPAGGAGTRLGIRTPKQFLRVAGQPILTRTVALFARHPSVAIIVVAAPSAHVERVRRLLAPLARRPRRPPVVLVVEGGLERQDSVGRALQAVPEDAEFVVVHDAVRPFIERALVDAVLEGAARAGAAICALPISDTVKRVRDGLVSETVDRTGLWAVQTPQAFRAGVLREAHDKARRDGVTGTDDAMLVERLGQPVAVVPGAPSNVKITTPADLRRARGNR